MMKCSSLSNKKKLLNLLLVDDEVAILDLNALILENNFNIFKAGNLGSAYEIIKNNDIQIIISDHFIKDENGLNFLLDLKEDYPKIIKILFTSCVSKEVMLESHNSQEVFKYLTKPCPNESLLENAKLAEVAWQVLQIEGEIKREHGELKEIIGDISKVRFKFNAIQKMFSNLYFSASRNLLYLSLSILASGVILLAILYSLKSLLGIDVFK